MAEMQNFQPSEQFTVKGLDNHSVDPWTSQAPSMMLAMAISPDYCLFLFCEQALGCQILDILHQSCNCGIPDVRDALER